MPLITGPKGAPDIFPPESERRNWIISRAEKTFRLGGYRPIETPVFEHTELFERGLTAGSDIVTKEMYTFSDKGGRSLTLRPDMTAPVMRSILEHGLDRAGLPVKLFYTAPVFRHERPQAGRYRQFRQVGIEAVGASGPSVDAEVISLAAQVLAEIGLSSVELRLNSIGHEGCRSTYLPHLVQFLEAHLSDLCEDCRRKKDTNPLRTFDCKKPQDREIMRGAPLLPDYLCRDCKDHYEGLKSLLAGSEISFIEDPTLVRGLDYYSRTAFELIASGLGSQNAVGAGGRYDGLAEQIGGSRPLPGIGFGLGVDRMALALADGTPDEPSAMLQTVEVFVVSVGAAARQAAFEIVTELRRAGIAADLDHTGRALGGQFRAADRAGARWAVVLGDREVASGVSTLKDMRNGQESSVGREGLIRTLQTAGGLPTGSARGNSA